MEKEGNNLFQVNLKGMIALLSEHIYSNPNTFVRELLQNCVDAITALRNIDENYAGRIDVFLNDDKTVIFRDNGIGLQIYSVLVDHICTYGVSEFNTIAFFSKSFCKLLTYS